MNTKLNVPTSTEVNITHSFTSCCPRCGASKAKVTKITVPEGTNIPYKWDGVGDLYQILIGLDVSSVTRTINCNKCGLHDLERKPLFIHSDGTLGF